MSGHSPTTARPHPKEKLRRGAPSRQLTSNTLHSPIHILNGDALLNIFYLYRLDIRDEEDSEDIRFRWDRQRWWYKLAQVSRKWRDLILASPNQLDIHLLCTYDVPVADMLAHSPPLPLAIWYTDGNRELTAEDEEGALHALSQRDRVHRVALWMPPPNLDKFIMTMDEEFPILERIYIGSPRADSISPVFPTRFQAPNLRHVWTTWRPIKSPLVTTTIGLVNLELIDIPPSPLSPPSYLLTRLLLMPQLETLKVHFYSPHPKKDVDQILMHGTLPHLHVLSFRGVSAYLEGLALIRAPSLRILDVQFFNQLTFTVPNLSDLIQASESLSFSAVKLTFNRDFLDLYVEPDQIELQFPLRLQILCSHPDWQVASAVQILGTFSPILSVVEELTLSDMELTLSDMVHDGPSGLYNEVERSQWRKLLRPFSNVKTLRVSNSNSLFEGLLKSMSSEDGEMALEPFPNLLELQHFGGGNSVSEILMPFITERQAAGHPVHLERSFKNCWVGPLIWQGTDTMRNEKREVRAQVMITPSSGDPRTSTWPKLLSLAPAGPAVAMEEFQEWIKKTKPVIMQVSPAPRTDEHNYGQLVKLLRDKGYYAIAGWDIQGTGRPTMNLLIASFAQGLLGAAFPISGIPEIPKPRLPQLDPVTRQALVNTLPPQVRSLPEPQLNFVIMQMLARQQQKRLQAQQGAQMPNSAVVPQQSQQPPQQQQQQLVSQADRFPQNMGTNAPSAGSMFGNMPLKHGELDPFLPGSQANAMASGLLGQPTSLQQVQQRQQQQQQQQQQAHAQHQQQQARQNHRRAAMDMQLALSGSLGAGVGGGLGSGLMSGRLGLSTGGLGPPGIGGGMAPAGSIMGGSTSLGFGNGSAAGAEGVATQGGMSGASIGLGFGGLTSGVALDGSGAGEGLGGGGLNAGAGIGGLAPGAAPRVTLDMFQSFMHRSGEGTQGQ